MGKGPESPAAVGRGARSRPCPVTSPGISATLVCFWEPSAVCKRSYLERTSLLATLCTPERQSLCESHCQRRVAYLSEVLPS